MDSLIASQQHGMGWQAIINMLVIIVLIVHIHFRYRYQFHSHLVWAVANDSHEIIDMVANISAASFANLMPIFSQGKQIKQASGCFSDSI